MSQCSQQLTQPFTGTQDIFCEAETPDTPKPWARLVPTRSAVRRLGTNNVTILSENSSTFYDIVNETFRIGRRRDSDWELKNPEGITPTLFDRISKNQCVIRKDLSAVYNPVYIEDMSLNGTFVNGELVGRHQRRILKNDDVISFVASHYKFFQFFDFHNITYGMPDKIVERYHVGKVLGSGACGMVRLVIDRRNGEQYAMKEVKSSIPSFTFTSQTTNERVMREVTIMMNISHPNIIHCYDMIRKDQSVYMFLELMSGGDLLRRIQKKRFLSPSNSKYFFIQLCNSIKYLHDREITHRDLKPENILLKCDNDYTVLKLSDFGMSKSIQNNSEMHTMCGTPLYVSPEILVTAGRGMYTNKVDIWSLGVVLYAMLSGTLPFSNDGKETATALIKRGQFDFNGSQWMNISTSVKDLIRWMLTVNPSERPSIDDIMKHPWLNTHDDDNENIAPMIAEFDCMREPAPKRRRIE